MTRSSNTLGVNFNRTEPLREKLIGEITRFERELDSVKLKDQAVDFCMIQTYKELIHSRREMLNRLPPAF